MGFIPDKPATVYAIVNKVNGRAYVGSTVNLKIRIASHFSELKHHNELWPSKKQNFCDDYDRYGKDGFDVVVLEDDVPAENRIERENYFINKFNSISDGYNCKSAIPITIVSGYAAC